MKHIVLLYDDNNSLDVSVADYINEGLKRNQFCVLASVHVRDEGYVERVTARITDWEENIKKGNLLIVDLAPFYVSAMTGDMKPFEEARKMFEEKARGRDDRHVRFVGDGTGFLFENRHFDECAMVEQWWEDKPFLGSYVCPFQKALLEASPHAHYARRAVIATHDVVINISGSPLKEELYVQQPTMAENKQARISEGGEQ